MTAGATRAARHDLSALDRRAAMRAGLWWAIVDGALALVAAGAIALRERRRRPAVVGVPDPAGELITP